MGVWVYVLQSETTGRHYVGITADLRRRLQEHKTGQSRSTRGGGPWKLVYTEEYTDHSLAREREKSLKSGQGREYLKDLLGTRPAPASGG